LKNFESIFGLDIEINPGKPRIDDKEIADTFSDKYEKLEMICSEAIDHHEKLIRIKQAPKLALIGNMVANTRYKFRVITYPEA